MEKYLNSLSKKEEAALKLSALFKKFSYKKYKTSPFEEYALYHEHRDFLNTEGVITFNNADGNLMALKADMTLSILKNIKADKNEFTRVYYHENVYRFNRNAKEYKEIDQCGMELIGPLDDYAVAETVLLALKSLELLDDHFVLTISHSDTIISILDELITNKKTKEEISYCIQRKNTHDLEIILEDLDIAENKKELLIEMTTISLPLSLMRDKLEKIEKRIFKGENGQSARFKKAIDEIDEIYKVFKDSEYESRIIFDTSVINPTDYYSGILMQGYIESVPTMVLAGGRYDNLAQKLNGDLGATGFAVYLNRLEGRFKKKDNIIDKLIIYDENNTPKDILKISGKYMEKGEKIRVEKEIVDDKYIELIDIRGGKNI